MVYKCAFAYIREDSSAIVDFVSSKSLTVVICASSRSRICGIFMLFVLGLGVSQFKWNRNFMSLFSWDGRDIAGRSKNASITKGPMKKPATCGMNISCVLSGFLKSLRDLKRTKPRPFSRNDPIEVSVGDTSRFGEEGNDQISIEDEISDVILLRKLVKSERRRAEMAYAELKKERMAAASASEEAMAMILKLQSHKSSIDIEANQYRRLAEYKQDLDREIIESLQWIIMKHENIMNDLEARWQYCKQKLKNIDQSDVLEELDNEFLKPNTCKVSEALFPCAFSDPN